jgi:hypothetical protein
VTGSFNAYKVEKKRFKIVENIGMGCFGGGGVIFSYPNFKSLQEGFDYIAKIDPYYTGKYGIVDNNNKEIKYDTRRKQREKETIRRINQKGP